jgi:hypothetical protein
MRKWLNYPRWICEVGGVLESRLTGVSPADTSIKVDRRTESLHRAGDWSHRVSCEDMPQRAGSEVKHAKVNNHKSM